MQFLIQHGDDWRAVWNKGTETPRAIYGPGLRLDAGATLDLADARRRADRVLNAHEDLLGVTAGNSFVELIGQRVRNSYIFVYDQEYRGLHVVSGRADVRVHADGGIAMFGSMAVQVPADFDTKPRIEAAFARALAHDHVGAAVGADAEAERLVIWADAEAATPTAPRLAWQVRIDGRPRALYGTCFVDAIRGTVIEYRNEVYECGFGHTHFPRSAGESADAKLADRAAMGAMLRRRDRDSSNAVAGAVIGTVMGWVNTTIDGRSASSNVPLPNVLVSIDGGGTAFTDDFGNFTIASASVVPVTVRANLGAGRSRYAAGGVFTYEGVGDPFCNPSTPGCVSNPPVVAAAAVSATASVVPGSAPITLQLSPTRIEFEIAQLTGYYHTDGIHRYVRGILGNTTQLNTAANIDVFTNWGTSCNAFYSGNTINFFRAGSGCNNSSFWPIIDHEWGHGLDERYGGISQTDGLSEGWGDILSLYRTGNPTVGIGFSTNGGSVRSALNTRTYPVAASAGVHTQGQVWMGFAWQVRENLRASLGVTTGTDIAEQIVIGSVVGDATNQPGAVLEVFLLDDDDSNLNNGVPHYAELSQAALARNLPFPELQLGTLAHTALTSTSRQLEPRFVDLTAVPNGGSFTNISVVFDAGAGSQTRPLIAVAGSPNAYRALLPGVASPQRVDYHFVATHSSGASLRLPENGDFTYVTGQETVLFTDDMENGDNGWTHVQVTRQDDWQRQPPLGESTDPNAAFSPNNVWGNDLGAGTFNGAYQNSAENFLRSPVINAIGRTGVTLEFQRWLGIESGQFDQAEIRVGSTVVWSNPQATDLVDTAWTRMTVPVPQLDNTAGQIEFRLRSDGGVVFGGWTIDDVRVTSFVAAPALPVEFRADPEQIPLGGTSNLTVNGANNAAAAILLSASPGPLPALPGLTLEVGASFVAVPIQLDASGSFQAVVPGNNNPGSVGQVIYSQVIQLDAGAIQGSNGMIFLFGN